MTYDEALNYIHSVSNFFCKPGLERISELCHRIGDPQKKLKFIHVTGTNGKGSVCSMLASILMAEGYKVGLYTSPYVREFNERIRINSRNIPNEYLATLTAEVKQEADKMGDSPTEFELITAIAFEYFSREKCDIVVLEVGMGGRLDATNIIESPLLSIITGISVDHIAFLGDTIEQISGEKACIIKQNCPVLFGGESKVAEEVIAKEANQKQSILYKTDYSSLSVEDMTLEGTTFNYKGRHDIKLPLLGDYQPRNASVVLDAVDILRQGGIKINEESVRVGLANAKWPARFEIIKKEPTVIFDGAHNLQGIEAAVKSIKQYFPEKRVIVISGVLKDKDYQKISDSISEIASQVYTITPSNPRALSAEEYAGIFESKGISATSCGSVNEATELAISYAKETNATVCCLGSLYTYCEIIELI